MPPSAERPGRAGRAVLLTAAELPDLHGDDAPLLDALRAAGWRAEPVVWSGEVPTADLALVRSCWDYTGRAGEFLAALEAIGARMPLWNPVETLRWNADKRYLLELAAAGVAIPPTVVVPRGDHRSLGTVLDELAVEEAVVKPLVGASGVDTWRARRGDEVAWGAAVRRRELLVQGFVGEVVTAGEWSLVFFGDGYSHAVLKRAATGEFRVQAEHGGSVVVVPPGDAVLAAAHQILAAVRHRWRYARVDLVETAAGVVLMELELIEPTLFFGAAPGAAERLVATVAGEGS